MSFSSSSGDHSPLFTFCLLQHEWCPISLSPSLSLSLRVSLSQTTNAANASNWVSHTSSPYISHKQKIKKSKKIEKERDQHHRKRSPTFSLRRQSFSFHSDQKRKCGGNWGKIWWWYELRRKEYTECCEFNVWEGRTLLMARLGFCGQMA